MFVPLRQIGQGESERMPDDRLFLDVPLFPQVVWAGFPNPADDYRKSPLNLHDMVAPHPNSTYFIRVKGQSMEGACIRPGSIVVVDRSLTPSHNKIVVARVGQNLLLKRMQVRQRKVFLVADPPAPEHPAIELGPQDEIWGLVTYCVQRVR